MSPATIGKVCELEALSLAALPLVAIGTDRVFHAGLYARTGKVPCRFRPPAGMVAPDAGQHLIRLSSGMAVVDRSRDRQAFLESDYDPMAMDQRLG
jgi:hypothetical protein